MLSPPRLPLLQATYDAVDFDIDEYKGAAGVSGALLHDSKQRLLQHRWRYPSLSLHGIEGAFYGAGSKTVIPGLFPFAWLCVCACLCLCVWLWLCLCACVRLCVCVCVTVCVSVCV